MKRFVLCLAALVLVFGVMQAKAVPIITGHQIETFDAPVPAGDPIIFDDIVSAFGTFSGGTTEVRHIGKFYASSPNAYKIGSSATLVLNNPVLPGAGVRFFFIHGTGKQGRATSDGNAAGTEITIDPGTATAFSGVTSLGSVTSNLATSFGDLNNFETLGGFALPITRVEFTEGKIDNVQVIPEPSTYLLFAVGILGLIGMGYRQRKKAA